MDFIRNDVVVLGTCTNLSESGLRGTFSEGLPAGMEGLITLYFEDRQFQTRGKIYSVRDGEARVRFNFASEKEQASILELMKLLSPRSRG